MKTRLFLLICVAAVFFSGCSKITMLRTQELRKVEKEVAEVRKELEQLNQAVDDLNISQGGATSKMKADLSSMLTELEGQLMRLHAEMDETQHHLNRLYAKTDKIDQKKFVITGARTSPGIEQAKSDSAGFDSLGTDTTAQMSNPEVTVIEGLDIENLYSQAREDYINGKYKIAYDGFKTVYEKDESGRLKDNALFWMAECLLKGDRPEKALDLYQRNYKEFPNGEKFCASHFKAGLIHHNQKELDKRNEEWKILISKCPGTNEAHRAQVLMNEQEESE